MRITIHGQLVGLIWDQSMGLCSKDFVYSMEREASMYSVAERKTTGDFEDHLVRITSDGDFQRCFCKIAADSVVVFEGETIVEGHRITTWKRVYNIAEFPSAKDFVTDQWVD